MLVFSITSHQSINHQSPFFIFFNHQSPIMGRGINFSKEEDSIIHRVFTTYTDYAERMNTITESCRQSDLKPRTYTSYLARFKMLTKTLSTSTSTDRVRTINDRIVIDSPPPGMWSPPSSPLRHIPTPPGMWSIPSPPRMDSPPPTMLSSRHIPLLAPISNIIPAQSTKRSITSMSMDELKEYEADVLERIKKRKVEIEAEQKSTPECPLCISKIDKGCVIASCGHVFCTECYCQNISRPLPRYGDCYHTCPICRDTWDKPIKVQFIQGAPTVAKCKEKGAKISI